MSRIGRRIQYASGSYGQSAEAELWVHDVTSGDHWTVSIRQGSVTYSLNSPPSAKITVCMGRKVAEVADDTFHESSIDEDPFVPTPEKLYEVEVRARLKGRSGYKTLFWGYIQNVKVKDASHSMGGEQSATVNAVGTVAMLNEVIAGGAGAPEKSGWDGNPWGFDSLGRARKTIIDDLGDGNITLGDFIQQGFVGICEEAEDSGSRAISNAGANGKWVCENLIETGDTNTISFRRDGWSKPYTLRNYSGSAKEHIAKSMLVPMGSSGTDLWSLLTHYANTYSLAVICGVRRMGIAPVVSPLQGDPVKVVDPEDIVSYNTVDKGSVKVRGAMMVSESGGLHNTDAWGFDKTSGGGKRVLSQVYATGPYASSGRSDRISRSQSKYSWVPPNSKYWSRGLAKLCCKQYIMDKRYGSLFLRLSLPYCDNVCPGSLIKVNDVDTFHDTATGIFGQRSSGPEDIYGTLNSTRISISTSLSGDGSAQVGGDTHIGTELVLSHVVSDPAHESLGMPESQHALTGQSVSGLRLDFSGDVPSDYEYSNWMEN